MVTGYRPARKSNTNTAATGPSGGPASRMRFGVRSDDDVMRPPSSGRREGRRSKREREIAQDLPSAVRVLTPHRDVPAFHLRGDRKSTRLNSSHVEISYAVFC